MHYLLQAVTAAAVAVVVVEEVDATAVAAVDTSRTTDTAAGTTAGNPSTVKLSRLKHMDLSCSHDRPAPFIHP